MKKFYLILVIILSFCCVSLYAQQTAASALAETTESPSYGIIGLSYQFGYFSETKQATSGLGILGKVPLNNSIGIELGLNLLEKPINSYKIIGLSGVTTNFTGIGIEEYTEIRMNVLYYTWFLKDLQFKMGFSYLQFNSGWILVDPSITDSGTMMEKSIFSGLNTFSFNIGASLDIPIVQSFCGMMSLGYKIFLNDSSGMLHFNLGLGYRF